MTTGKKTALSAKERIKAAYLHSMRGTAQQDLATAFEVNIGRVNEAVQAIEYAAANPKEVLELLKAKEGRG